MHSDTAQAITVLILLVAPLLLSLGVYVAGGAKIDRDRFALNTGGNGMIGTTAGAISGNVGIGTFLALFLFSQGSPVIGFSIAIAYTTGLLLCAWLAPVIHARGQALGSVGLIDLIAKSHRVERRGWIWLPLAVVFVLRAAVQLGALGLIALSLFGGYQVLAVIVCTNVLGLYLIIGGYRAAVQSDMVQAAVLLVAVGVAAFGLPTGTEPRAIVQFAEYGPVILVGIWLFIPFSALLAVDNWQRITLAQTPQVARFSYAAAALICGSVYAVIALAGYTAPLDQSMQARFTGLMPTSMGWLVAAMLTACIMSSVDTFIMPLTSGLGRNLSIARMRAVITLLLTVAAGITILMGDLLASVVAAFNTLSVFLPTAMAALFHRDPPAKAAIISMNAGLLTALSLSFVIADIASFIGFSVAAISYWIVVRRA